MAINTFTSQTTYDAYKKYESLFKHNATLKVFKALERGRLVTLYQWRCDYCGKKRQQEDTVCEGCGASI